MQKKTIIIKAVWGGLTNSCEKKRSEKQRGKRKRGSLGRKPVKGGLGKN